MSDKIEAQKTENQPTISMQIVEYDNGNFGVSAYMTGLKSHAQAVAAMAHIERMLCGAEIGKHSAPSKEES